MNTQHQSCSLSDSGSDAELHCISCLEVYIPDDVVCRECYYDFTKVEEELLNKISLLSAKLDFLRSSMNEGNSRSFTDVVLIAYEDGVASPPIPAHKAVLVSRSPVFKPMFDNPMEESRTGTIKIRDVSYDILQKFVNYLYTAEACPDGQMACKLLAMSDKYQVQHLKDHCEKFLKEFSP